eukprot:TRINITY_DN1459_c1_g1_i1.p1 TRINITY_DN1459_c1_g1~~TRINITY_DN1459_c1_g1_i1.p1  ORF type:complete len:518 (+),score=108.14 TRINITY_DN1459_c1_g1_i1:1245-2798(+)
MDGVPRLAPLYHGCRLLSREAALALRVLRRLGVPPDLAHEVASWREAAWRWDGAYLCRDAVRCSARRAVVVTKAAGDFRVYRPCGALAVPAGGRSVVAMRVSKAAHDARAPRHSLRSGVYKIAIGCRRVLGPSWGAALADAYPAPDLEALVVTESGVVGGVSCFPEGLPSPAVLVLEVLPGEGAVAVWVGNGTGGWAAVTAALPAAVQDPAVMVWLNRDGDAAQLLTATDPALDGYFARRGGAVPVVPGSREEDLQALLRGAEAAFSRAFARVLGRGAVAPSESFAALGGTSLQAQQVLSVMSRGGVCGVSLKVAPAVFAAHDTPAQLAVLYADAVHRRAALCDCVCVCVCGSGPPRAALSLSLCDCACVCTCEAAPPLPPPIQHLSCKRGAPVDNIESPGNAPRPAPAQLMGAAALVCVGAASLLCACAAVGPLAVPFVCVAAALWAPRMPADCDAWQSQFDRWWLLMERDLNTGAGVGVWMRPWGAAPRRRRGGDRAPPAKRPLPAKQRPRTKQR